MRKFFICILWILGVTALPGLGQNAKPKLTLDEFFDAVQFDAVKVSPDGNAVVVATERADWEKDIFRQELWLYRLAGGAGTLLQLTQGGRDRDPQWSPDGKWIAFLSEREKAAGATREPGEREEEEGTAQIYVISPVGGEAFAVTSGSEEVHSFAWAGDGRAIYFSTREPWTKARLEEHKKEWKDAVSYRADERGDVIYRIDLGWIEDKTPAGKGDPRVPNADADRDKESNGTPGAVAIARSRFRVEQLRMARDGKRLAFVSNSVSQRQEKMEENEVYVVSLTGGSAEVAPAQVTHNEAEEVNLEWAPDSRHLFFRVDLGSVDKKYEDPQPRLYWVDTESGAVERWFASFTGEVVRYAALADGSVVCACRQGTEVQLYWQAKPTSAVRKLAGWAGTYEFPSAWQNSGRVAFAFSTGERATEVYLADGLDKLEEARPITSFNKLFTERDLPKGKAYKWVSDDGTPVEGWLMYPPGKYEEKNLPMLVLIHGGPQDADGNHFEADWYQWDRMAATDGWLVFEPNYRGSTGYGDQFALGIVPGIVSRPGRDILTGVDALVKDGIADTNRLAIGGYSYGGYLTNWLITQTTRFKAAVTGAGAVEHVANWGNDDSTADDDFFMGGPPWAGTESYRSEAAIFQLNKVTTPTHIVAGGNDVRVAVLEDYLLERALHQLNVPSELLILPGEGHELDKNPWHGKIKVREELKWLHQYVGVGTEPK